MTQQKRVNYNQVAQNYDMRYRNSPHSGTAQALQTLVSAISPKIMLDVGCGTGRWLSELQSAIPQVFGLDFSMGMLHHAQQNIGNRLTNSNALHLPFADATFDYMQCLHAIHHFGNFERFLDEAFRVLKPDGTLAITHLIRPTVPNNWYVYEYFDSTLETDMKRYPSFGQLLDSLIQRGASQASWQIVQRFDLDWVGSDVFNDPFIQKDSTSQLTLLSDEVYEAGLENVRRVVESEPDHVFQVRNHIGMLVGTRP